jgi:hypothetical protein
VNVHLVMGDAAPWRARGAGTPACRFCTHAEA